MREREGKKTKKTHVDLLLPLVVHFNVVNTNWKRGLHQIQLAVIVVLLVGLAAIGVYGKNLKLSLTNEAAVSTPQPYGQTGNWNLVFADEFNGTSGELNFTAVARSCLSKYNFASGMVESNGKFNFTYGYMEARMWTPAGSGVWPAFWTDGQNWPEDGEIDVLEAYGTDRSTYHYHYAGCGGDCNPGGETIVGGATGDWHIYAADWEPGIITWYYDGQPVWQYTTSITSSPQYLIANLGLNSNTPTIPSTLRIDCIRVWQKGAATPAPTPAITPTPTPATGNISLRTFSTSTNTSKSRSFTINKPAGVQASDVMVAQLTVDRASISVTPPTGWRLIRRDNTTSSMAEALYYKIASGTEPSNYKWNFSSSQKASGGILAYTGVDNSSPIEASSGQYNDSTSTVTAPSITTTTANDRLLFFAAATSRTTISTPTGMTQQWIVNTSDTTSKVADRTLMSTGATGNITAVEGGRYSNVGQLVALRPRAVTITPAPTLAPTPTPTPVPTPTPIVTPTPTPSPAGISLRSTSGSNNGAGGTSLSIGAPAGVVSGNVMVAQVTVRGATTAITPPSGWSLIRRDNTSSSLGNALYYKVSSGSEPASYSWSFNSSQKASGWVVAYAGVNNSSPIDAHSGKYNDSTATITAPSVTTTGSNDRLLFIVTVTTSTTITPPSGFTQRVIATNTGNSTSYVADKALTSSGATGNQIGTEGSSYSNIGELVALRAQ
ncbi:MAG: Glucan endo-1,3-beta-D-glucosidase [Microgenomates group bacterium GW2011_GWA2_44_7]|nr:MAG: Glucan endo-1,3-beta-D-glucosidase [Microgenomates group bacterium GW2011_GWA2_44_7]